MMANKIFFNDDGHRLIQEDEVNHKQTVRFYCNSDFSITFGPDFDNTSYEPGDKEAAGWKAPMDVNGRKTFQAEPHQGAWRIKIKFKKLPDPGYKYTVNAGSRELDPRVVPPRKN